MASTVPKQPQSWPVTIGDLTLQVYEWAGVGRPVLLAHATGFHARCWDQVVAHMTGQHCYAVDLRGHGRSDKPAPPYEWRHFGEDIAAIARTLDLRGAIGIGHSLGGHAIALAAALHSAAFAALLLIDPVIVPRALYHHTPPGGAFAARRRNHWASPAHMFESFRNRPPFDSWQPEVLRDYCDYGLLPAPNGHGLVLACPPTVEAAIYAGATETNIYPEIATIDIPVLVLRAARTTLTPTTDMNASPTAPDLAGHFRHGRDVQLHDRSHFIPMEAPALVANYIRELI